VIYGVKEFLPLLRQRPEGHIVNVSSINAAVPFPSNAPYNISKYAIAGLSDTLIQDLADDPIHITCVHPGGVKTRLLPNAGLDKNLVADFDKITMTTSAHAARKIVKGIKRNKQRLVVGADAELLFALKRLLPMTTVRLVGRLLEKGPHGQPRSRDDRRDSVTSPERRNRSSEQRRNIEMLGKRVDDASRLDGLDEGQGKLR
jgi:short-subunit dehydrogenase